jgi:hypothetical protein
MNWAWTLGQREGPFLSATHFVVDYNENRLGQRQKRIENAKCASRGWAGCRQRVAQPSLASFGAIDEVSLKLMATGES